MVKTFCTLLQHLNVHGRSIHALILSLVIVAGTQNLFAANIILSPSSGSYKVGKTFTIDVMLSGNKDAVNAVSGKLSYPSDVIEIVSFSKSGSFISMWAEEPSFSNAEGSASFEGVALNPGFSSASGKVISVIFKAKRAGSASVDLKSGSVLANDGEATDILGTLGSASFTIADPVEDAPAVKDTLKVETPTTPVVVTAPKVAVVTTPKPAITSSSYPDSTKWYSSRNASFEWTVPSSVTAVRTLYSDKETANPTKVYDPAITNRSFMTDGDGVMYMHVQFKGAGGWSDVSHYKFQIDTQAPESVKASFPDGIITTNPTPSVLALAEDKLSGIESFSIAVDNETPVIYPVDVSNLYRLPKKPSGKHTVVLGALDKAGNLSTVSIDYTIQLIAVPVITEYTKKVDGDNALVVSGTTYPQTMVEVSMADRNGKVETMTNTSDEDGKFTVSWSKKLETGVYEMRARVIDSKGATSEHTENKVVIVESAALIRVGIFIMNWLSVVLIAIIACTAILGTLWYSFIQFARFRKKVKRTMLEAENTLKVNVAALRRDTEEFHTILVKAEKKRDLTKEEQTILKKFKKRLDITEKEIEKKLEQIA
jgi:Bacterial Ig-like domain